ncbi:MAG: Trk family potassium uptake protein [Chloroflexi bacterium]|nr:Trk family potassium uptake protein [Chloroflexota bacterium]
MQDFERPTIARLPYVFRPVSRIVQATRTLRHPPRTIGVGGVIAGFLLLISTGTVLLSLPVSLAPGQDFDFLTSLFTATSAVCVTGLVVVSTAEHWSTFGQGVILVLIHLGGLGIMTASIFILVVFRRSVSIREHFEIAESAGILRLRSVPSMIVAIVLISLIIEGAGAAVIFYDLRRLGPDTGPTLWRAAFHSISAFNNAGFDLEGGFSSLSGLARSPVTLLTMASEVILGGLSVIVLINIIGSHSWRRLTLQTKLVLLVSGFLLLAGFLGTLGGEFYNETTIGPLSWPDKLVNAFFHSVTTRTAGFSTVPVLGISDEVQVLTMLMMIVGGATGGTAGGIKVNTFAVILLAAWAASRGYDHVRIFGTEISHTLVFRAVGVATIYLMLIMLATAILSVSEGFLFRQILFESVSALGTVGLSTGITPELSAIGKIVLVCLMFTGRVGPLFIAYSLAKERREPHFRLPESKLAIG